VRGEDRVGDRITGGGDGGGVGRCHALNLSPPLAPVKARGEFFWSRFHNDRYVHFMESTA
jgi:hypothetical protein